jgi:hypothetical protein
VVLYGAAYLGTLVHRYLAGFCSLAAFLDKRAAELGSYLGLPVYAANSAAIKDKAGCVVVVCVKNIFDHEGIVEELTREGYSHIVYMPPDNSPLQYADEALPAQLRQLYNAVIDHTLQLPCQVPGVAGQLAPRWQAHGVVDEDGETVTAMIPTAFVYTDRAKNKASSLWADIPVAFLAPHLQLFRYFEGEPDANGEWYIEDYCVPAARATGDFKRTDRWRQNILDNRRMVYEQMCTEWDLDPGFFSRNAPRAVWNSAGHFNLMSGKHRAIFLLSKGAYLMPLKLARQDYEAFLNRPALEKAMAYVQSHAMLQMPWPVMHPYFYRFRCAVQRSFYALALRLACGAGIARYREHKDMQMGQCRVLCAGKHALPLGQFLALLGLEVTYTASPGEWQALGDTLYFAQTPPRAARQPAGGYDLVLCDMTDGSALPQAGARRHCLLCRDGQMPQLPQAANAQTPQKVMRYFVGEETLAVYMA